MSLTHISTFPVLTHRGFKIFRRQNGLIFPEFRSFINGLFIGSELNAREALKINYWYEAAKKGEIAFFNPMHQYDTGFHIFLKESEAKDWLHLNEFVRNLVIAEVEFNHMTMTGYQSRLKVVIANNLRIIKLC